MKKSIAIIAVISLVTFSLGLNFQAFAQSEEIASVKAAKDLAANAGGTYVKGSAAPALEGSEMALPIVDEETGEILGYVVAEKEKLIAALNEAGLVEVANSIAAAEAGGAAGTTVGAGIATGTVTTTILVVGALAGVGLALGGGGGGGGGTTSNH